MKKLTAALLCLMSLAFANDLIFNGEAIKSTYYNDILGMADMPMKVYYNIKDKTPIIIVKDILTEYRATFNRNQMHKLSNILAKYFKWENTATANKVTVEKEISRITINLQWSYVNEWFFGSDSEMIFTIFSQNKSRHQLVIHFTKAVSSRNEFMDLKPQTLYMDKREVRKLQRQLTAKAAELTVAKYNKKKKKEDDLFK